VAGCSRTAVSSEIRPLRPQDDRRGFRSGDPDLDRFFQRFAGQNQFRHHIGTTWIATQGEQIVGYATVSASHIEVQDLPTATRGRLPAYPLPVLRLARLAVSEDTRSQGIGAALLRAVFTLAHEMSTRYGCVGVVVDAKPDSVSFYKRYGFEAMDLIQGGLGDRPAPTAMFLPLAAIPSR
jgi:predicted N-acetyltransferase YhbS